MKILESGSEIDATFHIEKVDHFLTLVFESRGGTRGTDAQRNSEYDRGLELIMKRLGELGATIDRIVLHRVRGVEGSQLAPKGYSFPLRVNEVMDLRDFRIALARAQQATDRRPAAKGPGNPTKRLRLYIAVPNADEQLLSAYLAGRRAVKYWAFFANPKLFDVDAYLSDVREGTWTTKGKGVRAGDRALIWRGAGSGHAKRGVVAFAEVLSDPESVPDKNPQYWADPQQAKLPEERVRLRFTRPGTLPLLEDGPHDRLLGGLSVARARGGTVFEVPPALWKLVVAASGGSEVGHRVEDSLAELAAEAAPGRSGKGGGRGQGFGLTAGERRAVEHRAMEMATKYFDGDGWTVHDVSSAQSYDLECYRDGVELHVEVKGTTGNGESVLLTRNEVEHARIQHPHVALFVVSKIALVRGAEPTASGGRPKIIKPWKIDDGELEALAFAYTPS